MTTLDADPEALARRWLDVDPDAETRAQTERIIEAGGAELAERFGEHLDFGTAGLRGRLGTGPNRMNRVLVRLVAAAIADEIGDEPDPHVVIGFDARHGSAAFATDTARVLLARDVRTTMLPRPLPTPVLAHSVRLLEASAGVMVTASHNPRDDNGYKVYGRGGALLTSPADERIASSMRTTPLLDEADLVPESDARLAPGPDTLVEEYIATAVSTLDPAGSRRTHCVHTALHGVGTDVLLRAFDAAGFPPVSTVPTQAAPDPDFPTTPFPNPEEPGTLDLLFARGDEVGADLALANDPDADRLCVAVPTGVGWQPLSGDDLGCLLADHLLRRQSDDPRPPLVATTVTSSRLLQRIAAAHGATHVETLTGFKWIMHGRRSMPDHRFVCGYEEALGYAVNEQVPDKDGVSAALCIAELAGELREQGMTLLDRLDELHRTHGVHATGQRSIRFEHRPDGSSAQDESMQRLRAEPPATIDGDEVTAVHDLAEGAPGLPPTNGLVIELAGTRLVVRPSGTEPKTKVYGEVVVPVADDVDEARTAARARLRRVLDAAVRLVCAFDADPAGPADAKPDVDRVFSTLPTGRARHDDLALIVRCIDLTTLEGDDTAARVRALCAQARRPDVADPTIGPVAAVCVYPALAPLAVDLLHGTPVAVASVAGAFPAGLSSLAVRLADIEDAVAKGADEIDIVLNRSALLEGRTETVAAELAASRAAAGSAHLKLILEVGELDERRITTAARLAMDAGVDFLKTSTGKTGSSATPASVWTMAEAIRSHAEETGRKVGLKIAGGVRTADDALGYVGIARTVLGDEWLTPDLFRFGASSLLGSVVDALDDQRDRGRPR